MPTYASCHGGLSSTRPETFVPRYVPRAMHFSKAAATREIGADDADTYMADAVQEFSTRWTAADDKERARIWDGLVEGTRVSMLVLPSVSNWVEARKARGLLESDGNLALYAYYLNA